MRMRDLSFRIDSSVLITSPNQRVKTKKKHPDNTLRPKTEPMERPSPIFSGCGAVSKIERERERWEGGRGGGGEFLW